MDPKKSGGGVQKAFPLPLLLQWKNNGKSAARNALNAHLQEISDTPPKGKLPAIGDPRFHTAPQFRDTLREQLLCEKLQLQLAGVLMIVPAADAKTNEEADPTKISLMSTTSTWRDVQNTLERDFDEGEEIIINVQLRPLDVEEEERLFESDEPPPQLAEFIRYDDEILETVETGGLDTEDRDQYIVIDLGRVA
jgi:hypothetical protein